MTAPSPGPGTEAATGAAPDPYAGMTPMTTMAERIPHMRVMLTATGGLLVAAAALGWLVVGGAGAAGAAVGVGIVAASYLASTYVIAWADTVDTQLVLKVGLATYVTKFTLIGLFMVWISGTGWAGLPALGAGVVAGVVVWSATQIWWVSRRLPPRPARPPR